MNQIRSFLELAGVRIVSETDYGYRCLCPFHHDRSPSFTVSRKDGYWQCFVSCGSGNLATLLKRRGIDTKGLSLPKPVHIEAKPITQDAFMLRKLNWWSTILSPPMLERGIEEDTLQHFSVGWSPETEETIFPVRDNANILHGYVHSPGKGQYFYSGQDRGSAFFGAEHVTKNGIKVLVEGPVDALKVWQYSGLDAIASLGVHLHRGQLEWIKQSGTNMIVMLDNDRAGKEGTRRIWGMMKQKVRLQYVRWNGTEKDPGDINSTKRMVELIESAQYYPNLNT